MTKEEAIDILHRMSEDNFYGTHVQEACKMAVEAFSECALPSDLDEAAKEYLRQYNESEFGNGGDDWDDDIFITFKAGARWLAGQGAKATATVGYYNQVGLSILTEPSINKLGFKEGDELEITIRKK